MGRKSALKPEQWAEIDRRILLEGESVYALAKEFGVNESTIRRKVKPNSADKAEPAQKAHPELRAIAERKAAADAEARKVAEQIAQLPVATQVIVTDLSRRLMAVSGHLAGTAEYGAATAHRLAGIANAKAQEIDDADPLSAESMESLKGIAVLTKMANDASAVGLNLINANKEQIKKLNDDGDAPTGLAVAPMFNVTLTSEKIK